MGLMRSIEKYIFLLLIAIILFYSMPTGIEAKYTFTLIADETSINAFSSIGGQGASINSSGVVVFTANSPNESGVFVGDGLSITPVYISGTDPFGCIVGNIPAINDSGLAAFGGTDTFFTTNTHLCVGNGITTTVLFKLPGGPIPIPELSQILDSFFGFNNLGTVTFIGGLFGGIRSILTINGTTGAIITTANEVDEAFSVPDINDAGLLTYTRGSPSRSPELFLNDGITEVPLVTSDDNISVVGSFSPPDINNLGHVAFQGSAPGGHNGSLFITDGNTITQVIRADGTTGTSIYIQTLMFALNNNDEVAFTARVPARIAPPPPGASVGSGLFIGPDPCLDKVISTGDILFGEEVRSILFFRGGFNDVGQISFTVTLVNPDTGNRRRVVVRAEPGEPDPSCFTGEAAINIEQIPVSQEVESGSNANFTITVTNSGEVDLSGVVVTDVLAPNCDNTIGDLAVGDSVSYGCTATDVTESFANTAEVVGSPVDGQPDVTDTDTVTVTVINVNNPPVAQCRVANVPADASCQANAAIDNGSFDPDGDPLTLAQSPLGPYGLRSTTVTLTAEDDKGLLDSCEASVTVVDQTPPVLSCPSSEVAECAGSETAVTFNVTGVDNCSSSPSIGCDPALGSLFPLGITMDICTATDESGNQSECQFTVEVVDTMPPSLALNGDVSPILECAMDTYTELGAAASDACEGTVQVVIGGDIVLEDTTGAYNVTYDATDATGNAATQLTRTATVQDTIAPEAANTTLFDPVAVGASFNITAEVTDICLVDTAEYAIDDSPFQSMAQDQIAPSQFSATTSLTEAAVVDICIRGKDAAGNISDHDCVLLAVYDPEGGFVTGGGWIDSPAGAYVPDPDLTGKANFGFVSKYKKGASVPTGQTEFQFKAGDLNFHSSHYDWLVVAGPHAKFKGAGTINGSGSFGFMVTATDSNIPGGGDDDGFRIKIWDSDTMVYDNQMGVSDDSSDTTALGGGSIVIHDK